MTDAPRDEASLPLTDERLSIEKHTVETGRVRIIDRVVESKPQPRTVADVLVIPVVEEVLVVEKRYLLKEEIHVRTVRHREDVHEPVTLESTRARIERQ